MAYFASTDDVRAIQNQPGHRMALLALRFR